MVTDTYHCVARRLPCPTADAKPPAKSVERLSNRITGVRLMTFKSGIWCRVSSHQKLQRYVSAAHSLRIGRTFNVDDSRAAMRCLLAKPSTDAPTCQPNGRGARTAAHVNDCWSVNSPPAPTVYIEGAI